MQERHHPLTHTNTHTHPPAAPSFSLQLGTLQVTVHMNGLTGCHGNCTAETQSGWQTFPTQPGVATLTLPWQLGKQHAFLFKKMEKFVGVFNIWGVFGSQRHQNDLEKMKLKLLNPVESVSQQWIRWMNQQLSAHGCSFHTISLHVRSIWPSACPLGATTKGTEVP